MDIKNLIISASIAQLSLIMVTAQLPRMLIVENHSGSRASVFWEQIDGVEGNVIVDPKTNVNVGPIDNIMRVHIQAVGDYQQYSNSVCKWTGGLLAGAHKFDVATIKKEEPARDRNFRIYIYPKYMGSTWHTTLHNHSDSGSAYLPVAAMFMGDWLQGVIKNPIATRNPMDAFPGCQHILEAHQEILPSHILNIDRYYATLPMIKNTYERLISQWDLVKFPHDKYFVHQILSVLYDAYTHVQQELAFVKEGKSVCAIQAAMKEFGQQYTATME